MSCPKRIKLTFGARCVRWKTVFFSKCVHEGPPSCENLMCVCLSKGQTTNLLASSLLSKRLNLKFTSKHEKRKKFFFLYTPSKCTMTYFGNIYLRHVVRVREVICRTILKHKFTGDDLNYLTCRPESHNILSIGAWKIWCMAIVSSTTAKLAVIDFCVFDMIKDNSDLTSSDSCFSSCI